MKKGWITLFFILILSYCVSAQSYNEGTYGRGLYSADEIIVTPSGGGTSGGASCIYNWSCTNWFPEECPVSGTQERICANRGTCTGTANIPSQIRNCTYEHKEPLFDIFLKISDNYKKICAGRKIKASINLENYGKAELLDAFMTYWILDENNILISELKDTRSITTNLNFDVSLEIPKSVPNGIYRLYAEITYSGNKTALAGESFEINEEYCKLFNFNVFYIIIGVVLVVILVLIFILFKKLKNIKKGKAKYKRKILRKVSSPKISLMKKIKKKIKEYKKEKERKKLLKEIIKQKKMAEKRNKQIQRRKRKSEKRKIKRKLFFKLLKPRKRKEILLPKIKEKKKPIYKEKTELVKSVFSNQWKMKKKGIEEKYRKEKLKQIKKKHSIS